jgi:hypothetical protein
MVLKEEARGLVEKRGEGTAVGVSGPWCLWSHLAALEDCYLARGVPLPGHTLRFPRPEDKELDSQTNLPGFSECSVLSTQAQLLSMGSGVGEAQGEGWQKVPGV